MKPALPPIEGYCICPEREPLPADDLALRRAVADWLGLWDLCPDGACVRARRCRSRAVACFDSRRAEVITLMSEFITEGYFADPDGDYVDDDP